MIEIIISDSIRKEALKRLNSLNKFENRNLSQFGSEKERILVGYIGELMVMEYLGIEYLNDEYEYDIKHQKHRLEVKTISCGFKPLPYYLCTVNSYDLAGVHKQEADFYIFTRMLFDKTKGWILGFIGCQDFFEIGTFLEKGTVVDGLSCSKANATVILISQLTSLDDFTK